jgi:hypothetical protein
MACADGGSACTDRNHTLHSYMEIPQTFTKVDKCPWRPYCIDVPFAKFEDNQTLHVRSARHYHHVFANVSCHTEFFGEL